MSAAAQLEEVIVTAEKREARAQQTAISIAAFSSETLETKGIEGSDDFQSISPSLVFGNLAGLAMPYIRGIGNEHLSVAADGSSSMYVDGVYYARAGASMQEVFDVERMEILMGPQGTLYGRNSVGGSINIITNAPDGELAGSIDVILGNYDKKKIRGMINVPIADNLFMRASVVTSESEGFFTNLASDFEGVNLQLNDASSRHYGGEDLFAARVKFLYEPSDTLSVQLGIDYSKDKQPRSVMLTYNPDYPSPGVDFDRDAPDVGLPGPLDTGAVPGRSNPDPFKNYLSFLPSELQEQQGINLTMEWDLGFASLKSISSYREYLNDSLFDIDGTDFPDGIQAMFTDSETFTQELQLTSHSDDSSIEWVSGLFYLTDDAVQGVPVSLAQNQQLIDFNATLDVSAWAAYGQLTYNLSENIRLTAGLRYSAEEKEVALDHLITVFPGSLDILIPIAANGSEKWTSLDPKVGIDYIINDDVMVYMTVSQAFKSGGFNTLSTDFTTQQFEPEEIIAYEAGFKSELLDRRIRWNMAAFYYDYTELQQNQYSDAAVIVVNADSAEITGVDLDLTALISEGLQVRASVSYLDATFDSFITSDPDNPAAGDQDLGELGNKLPRSAELAYNLSFTYTQALSNGSTIDWFGEYVWKDDVYHSPFNRPGIGQEDFGLLNGRATWRSAEDRWSVAVWGKNLNDEVWYQNSVHNTAFTGTVRQPAAPRTFGLTVSANW
jgi:iron complex outermembrane receptor protein